MEIKSLQFAANYFYSPLYSLLFSELAKKNISISTFALMNEKASQEQSIHNDIMICSCTSKIKRLLFFPKQNEGLRELYKRVDVTSFDIIHAHTLFSGGYMAWKIWKKHNIPYIVAVRNTDKNVFFKKMPHLRRLGVRIMRDAYKVVFISPQYRESIINTYVPSRYREDIFKKSVVLPNGINNFFLDNASIKCDGIHSPIKLIYVGAVNKNKNLSAVVKATELLNSNGEATTLTVIGKIEDEKYWKSFSSKEFIHYCGSCPKEEVRVRMNEADIFVMTSFYETFGLVYAEAMSQGLPVIYTKGQGFDGFFPEGTVGYHVDPRSPLEITDAILKIEENYAQISKNCAEKSKIFNWTDIAEQYAQIYGEMLCK